MEKQKYYIVLCRDYNGKTVVVTEDGISYDIDKHKLYSVIGDAMRAVVEYNQITSCKFELEPIFV